MKLIQQFMVLCLFISSNVTFGAAPSHPSDSYSYLDVPVLDAVDKENVSSLAELFDGGCDINQRYAPPEFGDAFSALEFAVFRGKRKAIYYLLAKGAKLVNDEGENLLHFVRDPELAKALLNIPKLDPNQAADGATPFQQAVLRSRVRVAVVILQDPRVIVTKDMIEHWVRNNIWWVEQSVLICLLEKGTGTYTQDDTMRWITDIVTRIGDDDKKRRNYSYTLTYLILRVLFPLHA